MKKLFISLFLITATVVGFSQGLAYKFCPNDFKVKVNKYALKTSLNQDSLLVTLNKWNIATGVTGPSINLKTGAFNVVNSAGFGLIRNWYKLTSDKLTVYKTWNYGGMLLFGDTNGTPLYNLGTPTGKVVVGIMAAGGYGPVSLGPTYFTISHTLLLNLQATFTF